MDSPARTTDTSTQKQIADVVVRLFDGYVNESDRALKEVLRLSAGYSISFANQPGIFITQESLIRAVLSLGFYRDKNAAVWLADALAAKGMIDKRQFSQTAPWAYERAQIESLWLRGLQPELYNSVKVFTLRHAATIASLVDRSSGDRFGLKELIMALLHAAPAEWERVGVKDFNSNAENIRSEYVTAVISNPGPGDIDAWRKLVANSPFQLASATAAESGDMPEQQQAAQQQQQVAQSQQDVRDAPNYSKADEVEEEKRPEDSPSDDQNLPDGKIEASDRPPPESLPVHTDDPAIIDQLGRKGFARVLAQRIVEARALTRKEARQSDDDDGNRAFIVHLHGPWGAGKSTVLNFVREALEEEKPKPWLVVEFNAWRAQRLKPEWWSVILHVQRAAITAEPRLWRRWWFGLRWHWMRLKADIMPALVGVALLGAAALLLGWAVLGNSDEPLKGLAALLSAIGGVYAFTRSLLSGSSAAAQNYTELRGDPYGPMVMLFCELVRAVGRPVIVFVDDLDRCDRDYVCNLLESIQTMLRAAPITYLIAADRKWICNSFEKRYADFAEHAIDSGRPLGYQFLDKLFQISANLPAIPVSLRDTYWNSLLQRPDDSAPVPDMETLEAQAAKIVQEGSNWEEYGEIADNASQDPVLQQAVRAEIAKQVSSAEKVEATQHRLLPLGGLVESNPRSMKRLANAVGMSQARLVLEGRTGIELEAIARWTIIELRWPLLADWLCDEPQRISAKARKTGAEPYDETMQKLLADAEVKAVIGGARDPGRLTSQTLSALIA